MAVATGIRPLGGIVLLALALLAGRWSGEGPRAQVRWYLLVLICFVTSHVLADLTGAWVAVTLVAVVATGGYVAILQRPALRRRGLLGARFLSM